MFVIDLILAILITRTIYLTFVILTQHKIMKFRMFAPDEFPLMFNASVAALCIVTGKFNLFKSLYLKIIENFISAILLIFCVTRKTIESMMIDRARQKRLKAR